MLTNEQIAKVCHEANRAYCAGLGDLSQPSWEDAPDWQKDSAVNGVIFHLNNPGAPPSRSHELWLEQKRREGWNYGPEKDPEKKLHPCFLPYDGLPPAQQAKDRLFIAVVDSLRYLAAKPQAYSEPK
jgi:hypothetical protein